MEGGENLVFIRKKKTMFKHPERKTGYVTQAFYTKWEKQKSILIYTRLPENNFLKTFSATHVFLKKLLEYILELVIWI